MTLTFTAAGFNAAEFAELQCAIGDLHREWFPQWDGVHPADLPVAARLANDAHRIISLVVARSAFSYLSSHRPGGAAHYRQPTGKSARAGIFHATSIEMCDEWPVPDSHGPALKEQRMTSLKDAHFAIYVYSDEDETAFADAITIAALVYREIQPFKECEKTDGDWLHERVIDDYPHFLKDMLTQLPRAPDNGDLSYCSNTENEAIELFLKHGNRLRSIAVENWHLEPINA